MRNTNKKCQQDKKEREIKIKRLTELIEKNEYVIDPELLADAILKHLGMGERPETENKRS